jgi:hypothetical protein
MARIDHQVRTPEASFDSSATQAFGEGDAAPLEMRSAAALEISPRQEVLTYIGRNRNNEAERTTERIG